MDVKNPLCLSGADSANRGVFSTVKRTLPACLAAVNGFDSPIPGYQSVIEGVGGVLDSE